MLILKYIVIKLINQNKQSNMRPLTTQNKQLVLIQDNIWLTLRSVKIRKNHKTQILHLT